MIHAFRYRFVVPQYVTSFGQSLKVVGSLPELGGWDAAKAPAMFWKDGHVWALELLLPPATFEFKVCAHGRPELSRTLTGGGRGGMCPCKCVYVSAASGGLWRDVMR